MGLINKPNRVPELQRKYQSAFRGHTRVWKISPRSGFLITPYLFLMYGSAAGGVYGLARMALGYKTYF